MPDIATRGVTDFKATSSGYCEVAGWSPAKSGERAFEDQALLPLRQ